MRTTIAVGSAATAAVLAYAFQVLAARSLGPEAFAPITLLWTLQYLAMQVLYQPVEHFTSRETRRGAPPRLLVALRLTVPFGVLGGLVVLAARDHFAGDTRFAVLAALLIVGYLPFGYVRGRLAGRDAFVGFGAVTVSEAGMRLIAGFSLVWAGSIGFGVAMVVAPLVAIVWLVPMQSGGAPWTRDLGRLVAASAQSQALLGLAPLSVVFLGASPAVVSVSVMTFTMYRAPLWVLQGLLARLLPVFVDLVDRGDQQKIRRWKVVLTGTGAVAAVAALAAGATIVPSAMAWLLGPEYRPASGFSGLVAAGVVFTAFALVAGQMLLAQAAVHLVVRSWLAGLAAAATVFVVRTDPPPARAGLSFMVGSLVAFFVLSTVSAKREDVSRTEQRHRLEAVHQTGAA